MAEPELRGRLLGSVAELPSYLDRAADDQPPFEIRYPESVGGSLVDRGKAFPSRWLSPKERWFVDELRARIDSGENVLVFLRHTGARHLPERLLDLIRSQVTAQVAWLDASRVTTAKRQAWIDRHVAAAGARVLLVNPNAVRTGLNNLTRFSTAIWYELDYSATTFRQANGRLHRIGQKRPVTILVPYYEATAQEATMELVAKKVSASLQVDGLDIQAALEAAGAADDEREAALAAMSIGEAVYRSPDPQSRVERSGAGDGRRPGSALDSIGRTPIEAPSPSRRPQTLFAGGARSERAARRRRRHPRPYRTHGARQLPCHAPRTPRPARLCRGCQQGARRSPPQGRQLGRSSRSVSPSPHAPSRISCPRSTPLA